jgi:hypothetical protein
MSPLQATYRPISSHLRATVSSQLMTVVLDSRNSGGVGSSLYRRSSPSPSRDHEIVRYVARQGVVTLGQVAAGTGISRASVYRHLGRCIEGNLLERFRLPLVVTPFLRATRRGLRHTGFADLSVAMASLSSIEHQLHCVDVSQLLSEEFGRESVFTEREVLACARTEETPMFWAKCAGGKHHRPDLVAIGDRGAVAIEVELSPKGPKRLNTIVKAWSQASWMREVRYYCPPGSTYRAVERAIENANAQNDIRLFEVPPLLFAEFDCK